VLAKYLLMDADDDDTDSCSNKNLVMEVQEKGRTSDDPVYFLDIMYE